MVTENIPALWANTTSLPLMAVGGLAILGWVMAGQPGRGVVAALRMGVAAVVLVVLGAALALGIYVANGLELGGALRADPFGAILWFGWVGAQLAALGIVIFWARILLGRGEPA